MKSKNHQLEAISVLIFQAMNRLRARGQDLNKLFKDIIDRINAGQKIEDALEIFFLEAYKQKEQHEN